MNSVTQVSSALRSILSRIAIAAAASPWQQAVRLVAVSKNIPLTLLTEAYLHGQKTFGENYVQLALEKMAQAQLANQLTEAEFHFIGHLQRNKVKSLIGKFSLIHTVDRVELAQEISKCAVANGSCQQVLLQINISGEPSKSGVSSDRAEGLLKDCQSLPGLRVCGLMSIGSVWDSGLAPTAPENAKVLNEFGGMQQLRQALSRSCSIELPELSMGMSDDFEYAIKAGATLVRVGSAIFGERPTLRQ